MQKKYTIAVCDILGFKNLVQNSPLQYVIEEVVLRYVRRVLYWSIHQKEAPNGFISLEELKSDCPLDLAWFSDTILIFTREDTEDCLRRLLSTIGWLLFATIFVGGIHFRCGIAYGEIYIDQKESLYIGKPVVDAHNLEQSQVWSGGALASTARDHLSGLPWSEFPYDYFLLEYPVPCKSTASKESDKLVIESRNMLAINWTTGTHPPTALIHWSMDKKIPSSGEWESMPEVCEKWMNVNRFHYEMCSKCKSAGNREEWLDVEEGVKDLEKSFVTKKENYDFFHK